MTRIFYVNLMKRIGNGPIYTRRGSPPTADKLIRISIRWALHFAWIDIY